MRATRPARVSRADRWVVCLLVAVPAALLLLPAAFGQLVLPGDDLKQNLPLRVLVGSDLAHAHLPLWDPYLWSGTPLLGGFNAGAFYPGSFLYAFLPAALAWSLGLALTYALAGTGLFVFLRRRMGPWPAGLAALAFTWAGSMATQMDHLGLVEAQASIGWALAAADHLGDPKPSGRGHPSLWTALLALSVGLAGLAGDPRGLSNLGVVLLVFCLARLRGLPTWQERGRYAGRLVAAGVLAGMIASAQFLPGLAAQVASQRAGHSFSYFYAGSLAAPQLTFLAAPFLLGGLGSLHLPSYHGDYELAEICGYVGLLALAATLSALAAWWQRRRRPVAPDTGLWLVMVAVGILLSLGGRTYLGHLLVHVPLYGGQRLQSRNLAVVDVGMAALLGGWLDRVMAREWRPPPLLRAAALLAPAGVVSAVAAAAAWPGGYSHWLRSTGNIFTRNWPYHLVALGVAAGVAALVWWGPAWSAARRRRVVAVVMVVDIGFFAANALYGFTSPSLLRGSTPVAGPVPARVVAAGGTGRFAAVDVALANPAYVEARPNLARIPDLNVLSRVSSVQGYGSIVAGVYEQATGTHTQGAMGATVPGSALADQLDLALVLVEDTQAPVDLLHALAPPQWVPLGDVDGFLAYRNTDRLAPAWLAAPGPVPAGFLAPAPRPPAGAALAVLGAPVGPEGGGRYRVASPGGATLVRSEAWDPGWRAGAVEVGRPGVTRSLAVVRAGVLESVQVPPGRWVVSFSYRPRRAVEGLVLAGAGLIGVAALVLVGVAAARRRRD